MSGLHIAFLLGLQPLPNQLMNAHFSVVDGGYHGVADW